MVRGAHQRGRLARTPRRRRPDGGDEPADVGPGPEGNRAGRVRVLRFDQAAARVEVPRRHHRHRHAADRDLQPAIQRSAPAAAVQEHCLRRRAVGAARHRAGSHRRADRRAVQRQGGAAQAQRAGDAHGALVRAEHPRLPARHQGAAHQRRRRARFHRRQQRGGARLCLRRCDRGGVVPDHAVIVAGRSVRAALQEIPHRPGDRQGALRHRAGRGRAGVDRHRHRRRMERRARVHLHVGTRASR